MEGVLQDLGIEPVLLHAGGGVLQEDVRERVGVEQEDGQQVGGVIVPAGAAEAMARVKGMLEIALA